MILADFATQIRIFIGTSEENFDISRALSGDCPGAGLSSGMIG